MVGGRFGVGHGRAGYRAAGPAGSDAAAVLASTGVDLDAVTLAPKIGTPISEASGDLGRFEHLPEVSP